jgi:tetratricopeptide (TPR) repeat protein
MKAFSLAMALGAAIAVAVASASERSDLLVAQGQVAYQAGNWDEARGIFADAAAADPSDAAAQYGLGLAYGRLGRWDESADAFQRALALVPDFPEAKRGLQIASTARDRRGGGQQEAATESAGAGKAWSVYGGTGVQYDSNVRLDPNDPKDDATFLFDAGLRYDFARSDKVLLRLQYDLFQSLHADVTDFDFRANHIRGIASFAPDPRVWLGVQAGWDHYVLGSHSYLEEPWVTPFVSVLEGSLGLTQVLFRYGHQDFLSQPFEDIRDGPTYSAGVNQVFYLGNPQRYLTTGYEYEDDTPSDPSGSDYARHGHTFHVGVGTPTWFQTNASLTYVFRYDEYTQPNSFAGFRKRRYDDFSQIAFQLTRPIGEHVNVGLQYWGTWNPSNIGLFDYRRQIVAATVEVTY